MKAKLSPMLNLRLLMMLCLTASIIPALAQSPTMTETFTMSGPGELEVVTSGGSISVEGHSSNEVEVEVYIRKNGRVLSKGDDAMDRFYDEYELTLEKQGNKVIARAKRLKNNNGWNSWKNMSVAFKVFAPRKMSNSLLTSGGSIKVSNQEGEQSLKTSGGSITLDNLSGPTEATTSGGGIRVNDISGRAKLRTSGGGITVVASDGDISAHTSGGSINLEDVNGKIDAKTSGGGIRVYGTAGSVSAITSGGSIKAEISGLKEKLYLATSGGSIRAEIPRGMGMDLNLRANRVNMESLENFSGTTSKNKVEGTMNGGGIPVEMRTSGGHVECTFR